MKPVPTQDQLDRFRRAASMIQTAQYPAEVLDLPANFGRSEGSVVMVPSDVVLQRVAKMHDLLARWEQLATTHPVWFALGVRLGGVERFKLVKETAEFVHMDTRVHP